MPALKHINDATGTSNLKAKPGKRKKKSRFIEDEAEVSGSDCCSGDEEDCDEDGSDSLKDFVARSDDEEEEEGYEKLPSLSKKDMRLSRGDRLIVKEAARRRGRRRVLRDESESSEAEQDMAEHSDGSFVVEDGEDSDAVCEEIHRAMRESGLVRKGSRADARAEGVLRISEKFPFGLRDEKTGAVVNGCTGEAFKPASSGATFAAPCVRPKPHSVAPKPPAAVKRTNRQEERDRVFKETTEYLMKSSELSDEDFDAIPAFSITPAFPSVAKKQKNAHLPAFGAAAASQSVGKRQRNAHLPDAAQKQLKTAVFAMWDANGVKAKKTHDQKKNVQQTGVFMCKETGKCYKKNKDGTREELENPS